jgi:hypothetical protein
MRSSIAVNVDDLVHVMDVGEQYSIAEDISSRLVIQKHPLGVHMIDGLMKSKLVFVLVVLLRDHNEGLSICNDFLVIILLIIFLFVLRELCSKYPMSPYP